MKINWEVKLAIVLVALSCSIYAFKLFYLKNPQDTANYIFNALGFLPINVLLVTIVLNKLLAIRSRRERLDKMNMVIGTFFSEVGNDLIRLIAPSDPDIEQLRKSLVMRPEWDGGMFPLVRKQVASHKCAVDASSVDLVQVREFLSSRRDFMLRLLENPALLEHESFTDLLRAVFHLAEELRCRSDLVCLESTDCAHLSGDLRRVYEQIVDQWLRYMEYLLKNYPYLHSLEMRTNPFDLDASPVVRE
ncbi:hypothetical protein DSECCO2_398100 [anaerobic digester metagenome]